MKLLIEESYEDMSRRAADVIAEVVVEKPNCVLGLATGSTPIGLYADLVSDCKEGKISFKDVSTYNLDEYRGLAGDHDQSYRYFMNVNLFDHVDIDKAATHVPDGACEDADAACAAYEEAIEAAGGVDIQLLGVNLFDHVDIDKAATHVPDGACEDADAACAAYEEAIEAAGGVDIQLLGLGHNGHIGFNEPCDEFPKATHCVTLTESTIQANSRLFDSIDEVPREAYTMGIGTIMKAKKILVVANGEGKADIVRRAFFGPVTPEVPPRCPPPSCSSIPT